MIAAYHGHKHIVWELLSRNADANIQDSFGKKAIDRAKDPDVIRILQGGPLNRGNVVSPRPKEKGNSLYSPGRPTPSVDQKTQQEGQPTSILKKSNSRASIGGVKPENERNQALLSPEAGPSGQKGTSTKSVSCL